MTGFRPLPRPPRSQWRYRSGVAPDSLFSPKSPDGPGSTETGIHFRLHSITAVMQCQQESTPSHNNCTSYNSMNKFQQYAVGAVRRAANQNPTIAGGNRTITLSATSRPKRSKTEQLVERIPPGGKPKKPSPAGEGRGFPVSVYVQSYSVPPVFGIELLYGIGGHLRGFPVAAGKHHGRCHNPARHPDNHGRAHIAASPPTRSRDSRRLPSSRTPIREIRRSTSPFMSALSHSRRIPTTAHL